MTDKHLITNEVQVPRRSSFDKSHVKAISQYVGDLVPILCDEIIPNSRIDLTVAASVQLPPLVADCYANIDYKMEAFFVPSRILVGNYAEWLADTTIQSVHLDEGDGTIVDKYPRLPIIRFSFSSQSDYDDFCGRSSLLNYLGFKGPIAYGNVGQMYISAMPLLAYHRIWDDWYRNPLVQKSLYTYGLDRSGTDAPSTTTPMAFSFIHRTGCDSNTYIFSAGSSYRTDNAPTSFAGGIEIIDVQKRNYGRDYFTTASPNPQLGNPMTVQISNNNDFTIAELRMANSLQQFAERNNLAGTRMVDVVRARYGANLSDSVAQRSVFLGSCTLPVYNRTVNMNNFTDSGGSYQPYDTESPFGAAQGNAVGVPYAGGNVHIISDFTAQEPGYIFVIGSLVPRAVYSSGTPRYLGRYADSSQLPDLANPILQNTGNQPVYRAELSRITPNFLEGRPIFGYQQRYADWMYIPDQVAGEFDTGGTLASFVNKRNFNSNVEISSAFLKIPRTALDDILSVSSSTAKCSCWGQFGFDYKVAMPLASNSLPSLQDPAYEHGETLTIHRGGFSL